MQHGNITVLFLHIGSILAFSTAIGNIKSGT